MGLEKLEKQDIIRVANLTKAFGLHPVLNDISFSLSDGEILGIIGPSGGGKSTLLRSLNLLVKIDKGSIDYHLESHISVTGEDGVLMDTYRDAPLTDSVICEIRGQIGLVFQTFNLWEDKTVRKNLILAPTFVRRQSREAVGEKAIELCESFGLGDKLDSYAWQLSGGQRQRVAIIRALMMNPKVLLLDEITSALDPILTFDVMQLITKLRGLGLTMIIVTHHIDFASSVCDRIMFLENGAIVQLDTPVVIQSKPATRTVERFLDILRSTR
jgi:polar amino acid transport system ATP-binding protein